jgi:hypothetical protein
VGDTVGGTADRWNHVYGLGETSRSWYQPHATASLAMLDRCGVTREDSLIDVGGGASVLVDELLARGYDDVTVLDVAESGLAVARRRLGEAAQRVTWVVADLLSWTPACRYRVWHDRALFHFLTTGDARQRYLLALDAATAGASVAVLGTFAPDGPRQCSGLPVARYDAGELAALLGGAWRTVAAEREEHATPNGLVQPFTWAAFRRLDSPAD